MCPSQGREAGLFSLYFSVSCHHRQGGFSAADPSEKGNNTKNRLRKEGIPGEGKKVGSSAVRGLKWMRQGRLCVRLVAWSRAQCSLRGQTITLLITKRVGKHPRANTHSHKDYSLPVLRSLIVGLFRLGSKGDDGGEGEVGIRRDCLVRREWERSEAINCQRRQHRYAGENGLSKQYIEACDEAGSTRRRRMATYRDTSGSLHSVVSLARQGSYETQAQASVGSTLSSGHDG